MIFSKFFKAKWQSKDDVVRLTAVKKELDQTNNDDIAILENIALHDANNDIRIAALKKLNNNQLYWSLLDSDNEVIKVFALQAVEKGFLNNLSDTSIEQKRNFLTITKKTALIENWYQLEHDVEIQTALFRRLNKPNFLYTAFINAQSDELQQTIIAEVNEQNLLEKCAKKTNYEGVLAVINQKIESIQLEKEKPIQVKKDTQLTLSMLLALKEQVDYEQVIVKREKLEQQWQLLVPDLECLSDVEQQTFLDKYTNINEQLDKAFIAKAEAYQQNLIVKKLDEQKSAQLNEIKSHLTDIDQSISNAIFESNALDEEKINQHCDGLQTLINDSLLSEQDKAVYAKRLTSERRKLGQVPVIAQSVSDATHLIARIAQLSLPQNLDEFNDRVDIYKQWLADWRAVEKRSSGVLPESLKKAHLEIKAQWNDALTPFEEQQEKLLGQVFKRVADVKRLIKVGKYNASFGVYKHAKALYEQLNDKQQAKVSREFDQVSEKIAELSDWEHYVATPRKQELLEEVQAIANQPHQDLSHQANLVKGFRKTWNSLGHAEEEQEKQLNDAFNDACEQAFAPCREFFSEQEKQREQYCEQREVIIIELNDLASTLNEDSDIAIVDKQYSQLKKRWQQSGEIDRKRYQVLNKKYRTACTLINDTINAYQHNQANAKNKLIAKATVLLSLDDVFEATNQVKVLQQEWKGIGFAGKNQENKLWQSFRKLNDQIFDKREKFKVSEQESNNQIVDEAKSEFEALVSRATECEKETELKEITLKLTELKQALPTRNQSAKTLSKDIAEQIKRLNVQTSSFNKNREKAKWLAMFTVLSDYAKNNVPITDNKATEKLPSKWLRKLQEVEVNKAKVDRHDQTLAIEILAGKDSPSEDQAKRLAVQVSLMQTQMTSGGQVDLTEQFFKWLEVGQFTENDLDFLSRLKSIYC